MGGSSGADHTGQIQLVKRSAEHDCISREVKKVSHVINELKLAPGNKDSVGTL